MTGFKVIVVLAVIVGTATKATVTVTFELTTIRFGVV